MTFRLKSLSSYGLLPYPVIVFYKSMTVNKCFGTKKVWVSDQDFYY